MPKKAIIIGGAIIGGIFLLLGVAVVVQQFMGGGSAAPPPPPSNEDPFGAGSGNRPLAGTDPLGTATTASSTRIILPEETHDKKIGVVERVYQPVSAVVGIAAITDRRLVVERALFVDRATGHMHIKNLTEEDPVRKYTNTTIPRIQRAIISSNGSSTIFQFLGASLLAGEAFSGTLSTPPEADAASPEEQSAFMTLSGKFLQSGIEEFAISPSNNRIAYLTKLQGGGSALVTANIDGGAPRQITTFQFSDLTLTWPSSNGIIVTSKASADAPGISFLVAPDTGAQRRLLTGALGLTTLGSPDGKYILYSTAVSGVVSLNLLSLDDLSSRRLSASTLPEKCVWSRLNPSIIYCAVPTVRPAPGYPDIWYRGEYHSADLIWRIDIRTESMDIVAPPAEGPGVTFDGVGLTLGPQELHLLFINRMDDTLYSVALPAVPVNI